MNSPASRLFLPVFSILGTLAFENAPAALIGVSHAVTGGNAVNAVPPQIEAGFLVDESYAMTNRTHELTAASYVGTTLTPSQGLAAGAYSVLPWPSYFAQAQWVANANENRTAGLVDDPNSYLMTFTVDTPGTAYLLLDNRLNGSASNATSNPVSQDPNLGGSLAWVAADGWMRVSTGLNPSGSLAIGDYIGIDEGGTVASAAARTHHDPGSGVAVNNFYSIYSRTIAAPGTFQTRGIRMTTGAGNMYVVGFVSIPEPATATMFAVGGILLLRRRARPVRD